MKTLVLGDIHGHDSWKAIVDKEEYDEVVFLGDYLDSFTIKPEVISNNLLDIIKFKEKMGDKCHLCYGNHDHSYYYGERCSGYKTNAVPLYMPLLQDMFNEKMLEAVYIQDDIIMSHAGVSNYWLKEVAGFDKVEDITLENILNTNVGLGMLSWNMYKGYDGYGDTISQSPIWIRPYSLLQDKVDGYRQIVGHTHYKTPTEKDGIYFNDMMPHHYIIIEDNKIKFVENKLKQ